jgi:hypothetical protein
MRRWLLTCTGLSGEAIITPRSRSESATFAPPLAAAGSSPTVDEDVGARPSIDSHGWSGVRPEKISEAKNGTSLTLGGLLGRGTTDCQIPGEQAMIFISRW